MMAQITQILRVNCQGNIKYLFDWQNITFNCFKKVGIFKCLLTMELIEHMGEEICVETFKNETIFGFWGRINTQGQWDKKEPCYGVYNCFKHSGCKWITGGVQQFDLTWFGNQDLD